MTGKSKPLQPLSAIVLVGRIGAWGHSLVVVVGVRIGGAAGGAALGVVGAGGVGGGADLGCRVRGRAAGGGGLTRLERRDVKRLGVGLLQRAGEGETQERSQGNEGLEGWCLYGLRNGQG